MRDWKFYLFLLLTCVLCLVTVAAFGGPFRFGGSGGSCAGGACALPAAPAIAVEARPSKVLEVPVEVIVKAPAKAAEKAVEKAKAVVKAKAKVEAVVVVNTEAKEPWQPVRAFLGRFVHRRR